MKLATINESGQDVVIAAVTDATEAVRLTDAAQAAGINDLPGSVRGILEAGDDTLTKARQAVNYAEQNPQSVQRLNLNGLSWRPPVPNPPKFLGVAMNNRALNHTAHVDPAGPMFFLKPSSCMVGHGDAIVVPEKYGFTFPELELGLVIGKRGKNIAAQDALEYVAGYTIVNDVTSQGLKAGDSIATDVSAEKKASPGYEQYFNWRRTNGEDDRSVYFTYHARSKGADTFGPVGPWLTTRDEVANPNELEVRGYADGDVFAKDTTASYSYPVEHIVHWASQVFTLEPGDIITCGTAAKGVGKFVRGHHEIDMSRMTPLVAVEIHGLGRLENPVQH